MFRSRELFVFKNLSYQKAAIFLLVCVLFVSLRQISDRKHSVDCECAEKRREADGKNVCNEIKTCRLQMKTCENLSTASHSLTNIGRIV